MFDITEEHINDMLGVVKAKNNASPNGTTAVITDDCCDNDDCLDRTYPSGEEE